MDVRRGLVGVKRRGGAVVRLLKAVAHERARQGVCNAKADARVTGARDARSPDNHQVVAHRVRSKVLSE